MGHFFDFFAYLYTYLMGNSGAIDTSFRNVRQTIPERFDHIKSLIINFIFSTCLHKSVL